jgi:predicted MFS family arabinose efflux permease
MSTTSGRAASAAPNSTRLASFALLCGNFVIGLSILAPAGMIADLAAGLSVTVTQAALLVTLGAIVLCIGSPLVAWVTNGFDRRRLLAGSLALLALGHAGSALAPGLGVLILLRLVSMAAAAIFTPQAASTIAMMVPERQRPGAISFIFLGWSLSVAIGLPLVAWGASHFGWRSVYLALAFAAALSAVLVWLPLPSGLRAPAMSLASWGQLFRNRLVLLLLAATAISAAGQFVIFTYLGPLLQTLASATATEIAGLFAVFGVAGVVGNLLASQFVARFGPYRTSLLFMGTMALGALAFAAGAGFLPLMMAGAALWGLGFASTNSMQQARLAGAVPALAGAAIALNSSAIYVGQAVGSFSGGVFFDAGRLVMMGYVAAAVLLVSFAIIASTRPR